MMKMIAVVFACLVAASSAQLIADLGLGDTTWSHESTAQQHAPWAASASTRSQVHGPDAALVAAAPVIAAAPVVHSSPLLAAAPIVHSSPLLAAAPVVHSGLPLAYALRR